MSLHDMTYPRVRSRPGRAELPTFGCRSLIRRELAACAKYLQDPLEPRDLTSTTKYREPPSRVESCCRGGPNRWSPHAHVVEPTHPLAGIVSRLILDRLHRLITVFIRSASIVVRWTSNPLGVAGPTHTQYTTVVSPLNTV